MRIERVNFQTAGVIGGTGGRAHLFDKHLVAEPLCGPDLCLGHCEFCDKSLIVYFHVR